MCASLCCIIHSVLYSILLDVMKVILSECDWCSRTEQRERTSAAQGGRVKCLLIIISVKRSESPLWTPAVSIKVKAAESHLDPCWEGRGWELLEGCQLHCFHCSPCHRYHRCCRCRERERLLDDHYRMCETTLITYMTASDIPSLLSLTVIPT